MNKKIIAPHKIRVFMNGIITAIAEQQFFNIFKVRYASTLEFEDAEVRENVKRIANFRINRENDLESHLYEPMLETVNDKLYLMHVRRMGMGVFTDKIIMPNEYVAEYTGVVSRESLNTENPYLFTYKSKREGDLLDYKYLVDAREVGNISRFVNHSEDSNVSTFIMMGKDAWHIVFAASRKIYSGEQLFINYGSQYSKHWEKKNG